MRSKYQRGRKRQGRSDSPGAARVDLEGEQAQDGEERSLPIPFGDPVVLEAEIVPQEYEITGQPRQRPAESAPAPGQLGHSQEDYQSGIDGIDRSRPSPAEDLAQGPA